MSCAFPLASDSQCFNLMRPVLGIAKKSDADRIAQVVNEAFLTHVFRDPRCLRTSKEEIESQMTAKHTWFVIRVSEEVVSTLQYTSDDEKNGSSHLFATSTLHRGKKIGKLLLEAVEDLARGQHKQRITIGLAHTQHSLIKYYESVGYSRMSDEKEYAQEYLRPEWRGKDGLGEWKVKEISMCKELLSQL